MMEITLNRNNPYELTLLKISELIKGSRWEHSVYAVGGCVRDKIMGKEIHDIDLAISYPNGGVLFAEWICKQTDCFKENSNPCVFPTYGTAKFNIRSISEIDNIDIECVQTRKEQYHNTNSRNPSTVYGSIFDDAHRRDLTINSLYLNLSNMKVFDPTKKGIGDIHNQIIRTPNDPDIVFKDDPLRILRVIRFASRFKWGIEKQTWFGMIKNAHRLAIISYERIKEELCKIMECEKPSLAFKRMDGCGILEMLLPEVYQMKGVKQNKYHFGDVYEHTMSVVDKTYPIALHRIAALYHDCGKVNTQTFRKGDYHFYGHEDMSAIIAKRALSTLKFSNKDINSICCAIKEHMRLKQYGDKCPSDKALRKLLKAVGDDNLLITLDVINADNNSHSEAYNAPNQVSLIVDRLKHLDTSEKEVIKLPLNGKDIMKLFNIKPSPIVGEYLKIVEDAVMENPNITKEECVELLKSIKNV